MSLTKSILLPEHFYHIYNHGNADDNIFKNENNYIYFLKRYAFFVSPFANTIAYSLLPNRFHFIIQVKDEISISELYKMKNPAKIIVQVMSCMISFSSSSAISLMRIQKLVIKCMKETENYSSYLLNVKRLTMICI